MQSYGSRHLDASVLLLPLVGFLPADDDRIAGTYAAIQGGLMEGRLRPPAGGTMARQGRGRVPALHLLAGRRPGDGRAAK